MAMESGGQLLARFGHTALRRFFSSAPELIRRGWTCLKEESDEPQEQSSTIYKRALRLQRPTSVRFRAALRNSVSLIGTIETPLQQCRRKYDDRFCLFTVLRVYSSAGTSYGGFRVLLKFWDEIAQMSMEYLKPSDLVYVSGNLGSYVRAGDDPKKIRDYEVIVTEVNFVAQQRLEPSSPNSLISKSQASASASASKEEVDKKRRDRLHLWQVYFANPCEWLDLRSRKKHPNGPDFKHKDSGEALWIRESDPFWVTRQLRLLDLRSGVNAHSYRARPNLTQLVYTSIHK